MSTMKRYAKQAKERMRSGFWEQAKEQLEKEKQVAVTQGLDSVKVAQAHHDLLAKQIYNHDEYIAEQEFYQKVVEIAESKQLIINPLQQLADHKAMEGMTAEQRQAYMMRLSVKYQEALEKYYSLGGKKVD